LTDDARCRIQDAGWEGKKMQDEREEIQDARFRMQDNHGR